MTWNKLVLTWYVDAANDGIVLKTFLRDIKRISRKTLAEIKFKGGTIYINGKQETVRKRLHVGDKVTVSFPREEVSQKIKRIELPLDIIYEDEHVLVINKPSSIVTIPTKDHDESSVAGMVLHYFETIGWPATFHAVNRLDRDTSGLMLVAKHRHSHDLCVKMQQQGSIQRTYVALVMGEMPWHVGSIHFPIARKSSSIIERERHCSGQKATTHYHRLNKNHLFSEVKLLLETGRTHQIRVHMASLGYPLVGDTLYGGEMLHMKRQALHSYELAFCHPLTGQKHHYRANIPEEFYRS
ncbi:RluA family pseudouridine synthase [Salipaludibacillus daqingensis]|uniref:RluA family pseudouridine synthase n=1 Tax=Salipaludibacillus daqingensis TaxID=3041001 RepID=UPI00247343DF|nr:RluA family pseudouridine synthase [Salipaludibacillus daqingensis]